MNSNNERSDGAYAKALRRAQVIQTDLYVDDIVGLQEINTFLSNDTVISREHGGRVIEKVGKGLCPV